MDALNRFEAIPFPLEAELGSFELSIRDILDLREGAILRTTHPAKAPVTLRAGGSPIATGEVVVVDALSVRITNMLHNPSAANPARERSRHSSTSFYRRRSRRHQPRPDNEPLWRGSNVIERIAGHQREAGAARGSKNMNISRPDNLRRLH